MHAPSNKHTAHIADAFGAISDDINNIQAEFEASDSVLHAKRNTIKQLQLGKYSVVAKLFNPPGLLRAWIYANFRRSKARRSFEHAAQLRTLGVNTPEPVAYIESVRHCRLGASYYLSLLCNHDFSMQEVMQNPDHEKFKIIEGFARFTYSMHEAGVLHLDHNAGNTLITKTDSTYRYSVIDINRMQFVLPPRQLSLKQRLNNFVRLTDNNAIMRSFATTYAQCVNEKPETCIALLNKLKTRHNQKLRVKRFFKALLKGNVAF